MIRLDRIQHRMQALGLNPNSASQRGGLDRDYVRNILRGKIKDPSASKLTQLAEALQCSPAYLLGMGGDEDVDILPVDADSDNFIENNFSDHFRLSEDLTAGDRPDGIADDVLSLDRDQDYIMEVVHTINDLLYAVARFGLSVTSAELNILVGRGDTLDYQNAMKRAILAKGLRLIDKATYRNAVRVIAIWNKLAGAPDGAGLRSSETIGHLNTILNHYNFPADAPDQHARLAIWLVTTDVAKALSRLTRDLLPDDISAHPR